MDRQPLSIQFLGAARSVTGSCFLIQHGTHRLLVDCGIVQGAREMVERNRLPFPFDPASVDAVVLTHAHLDHTGLVPRLTAEGFRGRVLTTAATKDLLRLLWEDYLRIQQSDGKRRPAPLYSEADLAPTLARCEGHAYGKELSVTSSCRLRFADAGHILGSAIVEMWITEGQTVRKLVFSGDLGHRHKPIVRDPAIITEADLLVLEATYGDRNHRSMTETVRELGGAIRETLQAGGTVLMPVYTIGRSQDVLYVINQLTLSGLLNRPRVFLDSPMAIRAAEIYSRHLELFDEEALGLMRRPPKNPLAPQVTFTMTAAESRGIARFRSAVILAGSGMCEGGRILAHLARHVGDPRSCVIFTGFQVEGTLGRRLVDGMKTVRILGEAIPVRARIHTINGLSAHADQTGLMEWVGAFRDPKPRTFLVHAEPQKMDVFAGELQKRYGIVAGMPQWQETAAL
jgi:metallo-beta-lactamase family protein